MTPDPFTAVLTQLAEHTEQIIRLDTREAEHFTAITGRLTELTDLITGIGRTPPGRHARPDPARGPGPPGRRASRPAHRGRRRSR